MPETNNAYKIPVTWVSLNDLTGIPIGTELMLQNVGVPGDVIDFAFSGINPVEPFVGQAIDQIRSVCKVPKSDFEVWVRYRRLDLSANGTRLGLLSVQVSGSSIQHSIDTVTTLAGVEGAANKTLLTDAWARMKAVHDVSLFHGMFTDSIPVATWFESINGIEQQSFTYTTSVNGKLRLVSNGLSDDSVKTVSFRNPRYEPNRGHLYSPSIFIPNKTALGTRNFGIFNKDAGVFFRVKSGGGLYAVIRTTIDDLVSEIEEQITLPSDIDIENGWTYDIQFQWRGVGAYFFFVGQILVHVIDTQGTRTELTMWNPAAPCSFECINQGDDVIIECGCIDVTSEGGSVNGKTYGSIAPPSESRTISIPGPNTYNTPVLVVRNKKLIGTQLNTRDVLALLASAYSNEKSIVSVYVTRDDTAITLNGQAYADFGDGRLEYVSYGLNADGSVNNDEISFDTTKAQLVFSAQVSADSTYATSALFEGRTEIYQTPGDTFIFAMHRDNGGAADVGVTYEFAEAI